MLDRSPTTPRPDGRHVPPPSILFAKFPPDNADPPDRPAPAAGGNSADNGNFRRGRFSPIAIGVAVLLVFGAVAAIYLGAKTESEKLTVQQIATEKKNIFVLPKKEQIPLWRKWAADTSEPMLQQEALIQLGVA